MSDSLRIGSAISVINDIQGHQKFLKEISQAINLERLHHAWLLTGPSGIGKASMAKLVAAWLLSETTLTDQLPDSTAPLIKLDLNDNGAGLVLNRSHPDYMEITPAESDNKSGQIKVDQIRQLQPFMMHKPARGGWRIALIDSMDEVNWNSANAMLKLLEEPPEKVVIFLIASRLGRVPPTIRSRCRLVKLASLPKSNCQAVLKDILPDKDEIYIETLTILSEGAPGQAIKLAKTGAADMYQVVCALLTAPNLDTLALIAVCEKWGRGKANGRDVREGAVICISRLFRLAALYATGLETMPCCRFEKPVIDKLAQSNTAERLAHLHNEFIGDASRAEGLYLDFGRFLERHLIELCQKTLL